MTIPNSSRTHLLNGLIALGCTAALAFSASAQDRGPDAQKHKLPPDKPTTSGSAETDASRYCANVAPSIVEARVAWRTKRLTELDEQVKQRITDLEKAEASAREWIDKRAALLKAASNDLVAIYTKMQPENAARQIGTMDDRMAAAILGKLKPAAAGAILDEMEAERASRLGGMIAGAEEKKS
jgi:flagellar motility protein MotE (MotC chaperone)